MIHNYKHQIYLMSLINLQNLIRDLRITTVKSISVKALPETGKHLLY